MRVWRHLDPSTDLPEHKDSYSFACNLLHIDDDTCEVAQAMGDLDHEVALAIGAKAIELGYKRLIFCRSTGGPAVREAAYVRTHDELDYYEIDLIEALNASN